MTENPTKGSRVGFQTYLYILTSIYMTVSLTIYGIAKDGGLSKKLETYLHKIYLKMPVLLDKRISLKSSMAGGNCLSKSHLTRHRFY